jgi:hypothetical protein
VGVQEERKMKRTRVKMRWRGVRGNALVMASAGFRNRIFVPLTEYNLVETSSYSNIKPAFAVADVGISFLF